MSDDRKYSNTQYNPKRDSVLNPAQTALFRAVHDFGASGMKVSDVPKYLKETGEELKSTVGRYGAPALVGGLLGQTMLDKAQKDSPLKLNLLEQYGTYDKGNLNLRFGRLPEQWHTTYNPSNINLASGGYDINPIVHPDTFGITAKYKF